VKTSELKKKISGNLGKTNYYIYLKMPHSNLQSREGEM
jgi:hypothetical protein